MEAGVEHFSRARGTLAHVDSVLVVVEPWHHALATGARVASLAAELGISRRYGVGNKVRGSADSAEIGRFCAANGLQRLPDVPWDPQFEEAERRHMAALDWAPTTPGVLACCAVTTQVLRDFFEGDHQAG